MSLISLSKTATPTYRLPSWSDLKSLFDEWWYRIRSRCRDLADMGMTWTDAFNEIQKPFWQK